MEVYSATLKNDDGTTWITYSTLTIGVAFEDNNSKKIAFIASGDYDQLKECRKLLTSLSGQQNIQELTLWTPQYANLFVDRMSVTVSSRRWFVDFDVNLTAAKETDARFNLGFEWGINRFGITNIKVIEEIQRLFMYFNQNALAISSRVDKIGWIQNNLIDSMYWELKPSNIRNVIKFVDSIDIEGLKPFFNDTTIIERGVELVHLGKQFKMNAPLRLTKSLTLNIYRSFMLSGYNIKDGAVGPYLKFHNKLEQVELKIQKATLLAM